MRMLRAATLNVPDPQASASRFVEWMDYRIVEQGTIDDTLARSWGTPVTAGRSYVIAAPASGAEVYLRFVQGDPVPEYLPMRTYGWTAIEICVQDVLKVNERMARSPFEIIGPPRELDGLPAIFPMQVKGPDQEIVYLTQIRADLPAYDLPRAASLIDKLFILVLACKDLDESTRWFTDHVGLASGRKLEIVYTMLSKAFDLPMEQRHAIQTIVHERDVFLELDQFPPQATPRSGHAGQLPPGIALCTLLHPEFDSVKGPWISKPAPRQGVLYGGRRAGTLRGPDGALVEIVEGA